MNEDNKTTILLAALEERYKAMHIIRGRLQNLAIWVLGILFAASGWLFQSDVYLQHHEQVMLILFLVLITAVLFTTYIKDLEKGFKGQQKVAAKIENALGFYTEGAFMAETVYPNEWKKAGTEDGTGKYFDTNKIMIITGVIVLSLTILVKGNLLF